MNIYTVMNAVMAGLDGDECEECCPDEIGSNILGEYGDDKYGTGWASLGLNAEDDEGYTIFAVADGPLAEAVAALLAGSKP